MTGAGRYPPELAVGVTSSRLAQVSPAARTVHRTILRAFAATGHAPGPAALADAPAGLMLDDLLAELHDRDVIRLDERGGIRVAYPFSGVPTAHTVAIDGGPSVYAMCAIDALGVAEMLGRNTTITSTDPATGDQILVIVHDGHSTWEPASAVVFVGSNTIAVTAGDARSPTDGARAVAADRCCGVMNFFTSPTAAHRWQGSHPELSGVVLTKEQAFRLAVDIFGHLLDDRGAHANPRL